VVAGQGTVEDVTFRYLDGGAIRAGLSAMRMGMWRLGWAGTRIGRPARLAEAERTREQG
jgi:hypothetical protein